MTSVGLGHSRSAYSTFLKNWKRTFATPSGNLDNKVVVRDRAILELLGRLQEKLITPSGSLGPSPIPTPFMNHCSRLQRTANCSSPHTDTLQQGTAASPGTPLDASIGAALPSPLPMLSRCLVPLQRLEDDDPLLPPPSRSQGREHNEMDC